MGLCFLLWKEIFYVDDAWDVVLTKQTIRETVGFVLDRVAKLDSSVFVCTCLTTSLDGIFHRFVQTLVQVLDQSSPARGC
jgi:hypothetical protein